MFRADIPARWLLASYFALMHAGASEVNAGRLDPAEALTAIKATLRSLFRPA